MYITKRLKKIVILDIYEWMVQAMHIKFGWGKKLDIYSELMKVNPNGSSTREKKNSCSFISAAIDSFSFEENIDILVLKKSMLSRNFILR